MAHKVRIGGTAYSITGGRTLIGGTGYGISKGRTLVDGTGYDIAFGATETETWVWNDAQYLLANGDPVVRTYPIQFTSNGETFTSLTRYQREIVYGNTSVASFDFLGSTTWIKTAYKTITFSRPITEDMFDGNLLTLLQNSAVKQ